MGSTQWSDGKVHGPMMPSFLGIQICPVCDACFRAQQALDCHAPEPEGGCDVYLEELGSDPTQVIEAILLRAGKDGYREPLLAAVATLPVLVATFANDRAATGRARAAPLVAAVHAAGGRAEPRDAPPSAGPYPRAAEPDALRLAAAISDGIATSREDERGLRVLCWWRFNDPLRGAEALPVDAEPWQPCPELRANLVSLRELLDVDVLDDRLVLAEIARELGEFDRAATLLAGQHEESTRQLRALVEKRIQRPMPIPAG